MKSALYSLLILATLGAGYFTHLDKKKLEEQQESWKQTNTKNTEVSAKASATEIQVKAKNAELIPLQGNLQLAKSTIEALKSTESAANRELAETEATLQAQNTEIAQTQKGVDDITQMLTSISPDVTVDNLPDKVAEAEKQIKEKKAKLDEMLTLEEGGKKQIETNKKEINALAGSLKEKVNRVKFNATESVITAVNQDWGFVVIGAGSNAGFAPQTPLLVMRNGHLVGRVMPTSVEKMQTVAEIDFASVASGARLQRGDRVILAQARN